MVVNCKRNFSFIYTYCNCLLFRFHVFTTIMLYKYATSSLNLYVLFLDRLINGIILKVCLHMCFTVIIMTR